MKAIRFFKEWALIWAIVAGIAGYFAFEALPLSATIRHCASQSVAILQPALIFGMLFLTFCRIDPRAMKLRRWHLWLLIIQGGAFTAIALWAMSTPQGSLRIVLEGAMICMICPTATAAAVITRKLGGDIHSITSYTILINLLASILLPIMVPCVHPGVGVTMWSASMLILAKVFPLLLLPLALAMILRSTLPKVHARLSAVQELSFYMWLVALTLAMAVTTQKAMHSSVPPAVQDALAAVSLLCCIIQFWLGRKAGSRYGQTVTAGQSLGQKNTVFAIWLGYTFFTPVTALAGGFYSIWHNVINSWQLHIATSAKKP